MIGGYMPKYFSTKTYGHNIGLSACFRQPNAHSHCKFLHGYSLQFKFTFGCEHLDERNWVVDFGCFKRNGVKDWFKNQFDHTTCIAEDDPDRPPPIITISNEFKLLKFLSLYQRVYSLSV